MRPAPLRPAAVPAATPAHPQRYLTNDEAADYLRLPLRRFDALVREGRQDRTDLGVRVGVIEVIVGVAAVEQHRLLDEPLGEHLREEVEIFLGTAGEIGHTVLDPGDLISTGTPPGVGLGIKPNPVFLAPGDEMRLTIEGLGEQRQKVVPFSM